MAVVPPDAEADAFVESIAAAGGELLVGRVEVGEVAGVSHGLAPIASHEGHGGVADDGEKPRLRSIDRDGGESLKRPQRSVLHNVLGVGWALRQPFGE